MGAGAGRREGCRWSWPMARRPALRTCRSFHHRGGPVTDKGAHLEGTWAQRGPGGSWTRGGTGPSWAQVLQPERRNTTLGPGALTPSPHPGPLWSGGGTQRFRIQVPSSCLPPGAPFPPSSPEGPAEREPSLGVTPSRLRPQARALSCFPWGNPRKVSNWHPSCPLEGSMGLGNHG